MRYELTLWQGTQEPSEKPAHVLSKGYRSLDLAKRDGEAMVSAREHRSAVIESMTVNIPHGIWTLCPSDREGWVRW